MARIAGTEIPREKRIEASLTYIYGIGRTRANAILKQANINPDRRVKDLTDEEVNRMREIIEKSFKVEGELRQEVTENIKRLKDITSYRGVRHTLNLPVRGQRTKTNSRTRKGKKVTVATARRKAAEKK